MIDRRPGSPAAIACRRGVMCGSDAILRFFPPPLDVVSALRGVELPIVFRQERRITVREVMRAVGVAFAIPSVQIASARRFRPYVEARQAVFLLAKEMTTASFPMIGSVVGDRDHTTVMHGVRAAERRMAADPEYMGKVNAARSILNGAVP